MAEEENILKMFIFWAVTDFTQSGHSQLYNKKTKLEIVLVLQINPRWANNFLQKKLKEK